MEVFCSTREEKMVPQGGTVVMMKDEKLTLDMASPNVKFIISYSSNRGVGVE